MCCCLIFLTVFVIVQFVTVVCAVLGTPFDMYRPRDDGYSENTNCITLWGSKEQCYSGKIVLTTNTLWEDCPERRDRFRAAEVLSIITIALLTLSFIFALIQCCCCSCCKFVCGVINFLAVGTGATVIGLVLDSWYNRRGPSGFVSCAAIGDVHQANGETYYKLGAGLGLFIVATCLALINIVFAMLPC